MQLSTNRTLLKDAVLVRLSLIVLLVLYHAFAPFSHQWEPFAGFQDVGAYWWVSRFSYSFFLEAFTFLSGFILGYQVKRKGDDVILSWRLIFKKIKRLLIPSIFFSIIYLLLIETPHNESFFSLFYRVLCGVGHMWFLSMLFWCFVWIVLIEKYIIISLRLKIIGVFLIAILSLIPLPLGATSSLYYLLFFYLGFVYTKYSYRLFGVWADKVYRKRWLAFASLSLILLVIFGSIFLIYRVITPLGGGNFVIVVKLFKLVICQ